MQKPIHEEQLRSKLAAIEKEFEQKKRDLLALGFLWRGNIQRRMIKCNRPTCACAHDPKALHGPYFNRTTKVKGKTVSELLTPEQAALYEEWIENRRRYEKTLKQLMHLSKIAAPILLRLREKENAP